MKRILFAPFYSMRSYTNGTWLLSRDGHATQCRNIINAMCNKHDDLYFDIVIPGNSDLYAHDIIQDFFQLHDISKYKNRIRIINNINYAFNAFSERLNFDFKFWNTILQENYDLIIYENIENVRNIRAIVGNKIKIISAITHGTIVKHGITGDHDNFYLRMIDGIYASDVVWFNCDILGKLAKSNLLDDFQLNKLTPCFYYASMNELNYDFPKRKREKESFLFLSRFSDESRTNPNLFVDIVNYSESDDQNEYKFYITNPSNIVLSEQVKKLLDQHKIYCLGQSNRKDYINILSSIQTVIILYDTEESFSTAYHEALMAGCNVITLKHKNHLKILNANKYLVESLTVEEIFEKMKESINDSKTDNNSSIIKWIIESVYSVENNIDRLRIK